MTFQLHSVSRWNKYLFIFVIIFPLCVAVSTVEIRSSVIQIWNRNYSSDHNWSKFLIKNCFSSTFCNRQRVVLLLLIFASGRRDYYEIFVLFPFISFVAFSITFFVRIFKPIFVENNIFFDSTLFFLILVLSLSTFFSLLFALPLLLTLRLLFVRWLFSSEPFSAIFFGFSFKSFIKSFFFVKTLFLIFLHSSFSFVLLFLYRVYFMQVLTWTLPNNNNNKQHWGISSRP